MQPLPKTPRDHRPLGERVYAALRDAIVDGEFAADQQLVQEQLGEELGVSRTPVRDALARLAQEGLVTWSPGNGYLVSDLSKDDVVDVYQVRFALESLAMRQACGRHTPAQLARIRGLIEEMAAEQDAPAAVHFELNRRFHLALMEPCGNDFLIQTVDNLWAHPVNRRITKSYVQDRANIPLMVAEHRELLAAAEQADLDRLTALVADHLVAGYSETVPDPIVTPPVTFDPPPLQPRR
ncbi:MAG TPA: GntR family transcriptional regulator [Pseudonocardiaceae bacterium]|nr:GntR family transcriptional regulator [Pseudonocardiaceae bacterium]